MEKFEIPIGVAEKMENGATRAEKIKEAQIRVVGLFKEAWQEA
ncbi:MAG TPA: hypothetical protein VJB58_01905 [Candidatus Paceibacterota bacterium]